MNQLPRIAVGTVQSRADLQVVLWALMNVLERSGLHVQSFSSQSRFESPDAARPITGQVRRHLDSWLMPREVCSELFAHGVRCADIGIVEGCFEDTGAVSAVGGSLTTLCEWLDLPKIAMVDAALLDPCCLPRMPRGVDGILLDNVSDVDHFCRVQTAVETLFNKPVLGFVDELSSLRAVVASLPANGTPTPELCNALGSALLPRLQLERLVRIASSRSFVEVENGLFRNRELSRPLNIAVAFDDAFSCYFPDTLDVLESQGANVSVFSPLRSERLPANTDVVYVGCGCPEDYVNELAANLCMKESLWNHVVSGRRIYAESAGLAYLCREIVMPCGRHWPMVGLLPALARRNPAPGPDRPVEMTMSRGSWLFSSNDVVRGYLSSKWIIHPDGCLVPLVAEAEQSHDLVGDYQIVGSRVHLNFAACPQFVGKFFSPCKRSHLKTVS